MPSSTLTSRFGTPLYPPSRLRLALGPITAMVLMPSALSGSRLPSFFSRVMLSRAACMASCGDGIVGILDDFEIRDQVLDFGALVETKASHNVVVQLIAAHRLFHQARLRVRSE